MVFEDLKNRIIIKMDNNDDDIYMILDNGDIYRLYHSQDCCESVYIEDINGDFDDIIGYEILMAEESMSGIGDSYNSEIEENCESFTWTFYRLSTMKGDLNIRFFGSSNGYYSESATFEYVSTNEEIALQYFREKKLERITKN